MTSPANRMVWDPLRTEQDAAIAIPAVKDISLNFPITPTPRWGHGKPAHQPLYDIIDVRRAQYEQYLQKILTCRDALAAIPIATTEPTTPAWKNAWISGVDLAALHMFVATERPARYLEIGSGTSTKIARHAARTSGHAMQMVSIDPAPRAAIDSLCDRVIRQPLETVSVALFDELEAGDMLFVDSSHHVFTNSDCVVFFLDVLPRLRPGVLVHIHDIFLPYDYPHVWSARYYSEQYLLAAWLLAQGPHVRIELPNMFISLDVELAGILDPLWTGTLADVQRFGGSFWIRTLAHSSTGSQ
jgi:predicted O-methyltransferase YrrM